MLDSTPAPSRGTRAPRSDATQNRAALLSAAAATLRRDPDASLEAIAAEAGLSRRAVYGHFASRDDLVTAVLTQGAARVAASLADVAHADARIEIALIAATLWAEVEHVRVAAQLALKSPHREQVAEALAPARARLRATVTRGIHDKQLRGDIEAAALARLIESAAVAVLDEATRANLGYDAGRRLVMLSTLSMAGLGWREAEELIAVSGELRDRHDPSGASEPGRASANRQEEHA
jgi:AcrR family transcriptional regulator